MHMAGGNPNLSVGGDIYWGFDGVLSLYTEEGGGTYRMVQMFDGAKF